MNTPTVQSEPASVSTARVANNGGARRVAAQGRAFSSHAGAPVSVLALLAVSGFLITAHPPPYGPAGLALFSVAALLFVRTRPEARAPGPLGQPGSA